MKIGIDIGGSHIATASINENGEIIDIIEQDITKQEDMSQYILNYVDNSIQKLMKTGDIQSIGIVAPGNVSKTTITNLVNLKIDKMDFKCIQEKYKVPLRIMNDAKAAGLAEKKYGALKETKDSVFLCLGTGIGGAVFLNNQLLQANRNPGFEIGHMIIEKNGVECECGKKGCFETYCSMKRLKEKMQKIIEKNVEINGEKIEDAKKLKQIIEQNIQDSEIQNIIQQYIDNLIVGLSNVIDIFEPEVICLGGSFVYFKDIFYNKLVEQMQERKYVFNKNLFPEIKLAKLGNYAGLVGATLIK